MMRGLVLGVTAAVMALSATAAWAQTNLERFERQLEQIQRQTRAEADLSIPTDQRILFDYGGYLTFTLGAIDDTGQNTHILRQLDETSYLRINIDGAHEFYARVRNSYRDFNHGDDFDGNGDDYVETTLDRGYYRFDLRRYLAAYEGRTIDGNITVQAGRQLMHWANGLTLSEEIDGAVFTATANGLSLDLIVGQTRESITDFDSSRPEFDNSTKRGFYGAKLTFAESENHQPFIYGLVQEDANDSDILLIGPTTTRFGYDSFYIGIGSNGSLSNNVTYGVELVYQGGQGLSNSFLAATGTPIVQTTEDITAWAIDFQINYLLRDENRTRFSGEILLASGDEDRLHTSDTFGGNATGTKDLAFNAFGLIDTGLAFSANPSNLIMVRGGVSTFPLPNSEMFGRLQIGSNIFIFNKLQQHAPIDEPTSGSGYLGFEADFLANWQITSDLTLAARYGVFFPGEAILSDHDPRHFFLTSLTFAY